MKYYQVKLDDDSQVVLVTEHSKSLNVEDHIKNYGYIEETKLKVVAFQIMKGLHKLASLGYTHGYAFLQLFTRVNFPIC